MKELISKLTYRIKKWDSLECEMLDILYAPHDYDGDGPIRSLLDTLRTLIFDCYDTVDTDEEAELNEDISDLTSEFFDDYTIPFEEFYAKWYPLLSSDMTPDRFLASLLAILKDWKEKNDRITSLMFSETAYTPTLLNGIISDILSLLESCFVISDTVYFTVYDLRSELESAIGSDEDSIERFLSRWSACIQEF